SRKIFHAALLLLMLEAASADLVSLSARSAAPKSSAIHKKPADYPILALVRPNAGRAFACQGAISRNGIENNTLPAPSLTSTREREEIRIEPGPYRFFCKQFGVASRRLYILQVRPPRIGCLIVIPSNSELIYRHRSTPLAVVVRKRSGLGGSWGDAGARAARAAHSRGRLRANSGTAAHYFGHT